VNDRQSLENELQRLQQRQVEQPEGRVFAPLADCLRKLGRLQEALGVCHTGLARHPRYSSAYVILGKIHLERGDDEAAREAFDRVLEFDPQNLLALRQLAELDESRGDLVAAAERWELVCGLEIDPATAERRLEALRSQLAGVGDQPAVETTDEPAGDEVVPDVAEVPEDSDALEVADVPEVYDASDDEPMESTPVGTAGIEIPELVEASEVDDPMTESRWGEDPTGENSEIDLHDEDDPPQDEGDAPEDDAEATASAPAVEVGPSETAVPEDEVDVAPEAVEVAARPRPVDDSEIPTTEIATMTLAEIYAEQGFREKALDILRQVVERHPDAERVVSRIAELEADDSRAPEATAVEADDGVDDEIARTLAPEPLTLSATPSEIDDDEPEVSPSPPLEAPPSAGSEQERERERFEHFRNWLDRIRVDD